jgi:hypothetical protein
MAQNLVAERIAGNVRAEMARQQHTQGTLSKILNRSQSSLSRRLTGHTPFDVVELYEVAAALHVNVCDLLNGADDNG